VNFCVRPAGPVGGHLPVRGLGCASFSPRLGNVHARIHIYSPSADRGSWLVLPDQPIATSFPASGRGKKRRASSKIAGRDADGELRGRMTVAASRFRDSVGKAIEASVGWRGGFVFPRPRGRSVYATLKRTIAKIRRRAEKVGR